MNKLKIAIPILLFVAMLALGVWKLYHRYHGTLTYNPHAMITVTAPLTINTRHGVETFANWQGCPAVSGEHGEICHIDSDSSAAPIANYKLAIAPAPRD